MQPVILQRTLKAMGIEKPDESLLKLWQASSDQVIKRHYVSKMIGILLTLSLFSAWIGFLLLHVAGYPVDWLKWSLGLLFGIIFGITFSITFGLVTGVVIGIALSVTGSIAFEVTSSIVIGIAFGIAGGIGYGTTHGIATSVVGGITFGIAFGTVIGAGIAVIFGITIDMAYTIAVSIASGISFGMAISIVYAIVFGMAYDMTSGIVYGIVGGVGIGIGIGISDNSLTGIISGTTFSACFIIAYCRLPFYLLEIMLQTMIWAIQNQTGRSTVRFVPVFHHNLSYFPHPFLMKHLIASAQEESAMVKQILAACAIAPGQQQIGQMALFHLQALELADQVRKYQFSKIIVLQGQWLPGVEGADTLLLTLRDIARYLQAANTATVTYQRLKHLEKASHIFATLGMRLMVEVSPFARVLKTTLPTWKQVIDEMREVTRVVSRRELPNPFRAGEPLTPEQGSEVFRGRKELVEKIEFLIADPMHSHSIALLGPRRCGKTSLLNMLPVMLPDTICIFFDLQDNPIDSPAGFFQALAYRAQEQARRDRRLELPDLPSGSAFEAGSQWLQSLDRITDQQRILLCIDEFERLENIFPGERRELLQLMGLFRATIQHRRHLRLLISGTAPFNELDSIWSDHFINLQEVRIGHLSRKFALELLTNPIPSFPETAIPLEVAELIFSRTGGQPYLLQLYGSLLVQHLNYHRRKRAIVADIEFVEENVLEQATYYFRNTVQVAPRTAQIALQYLAEGHSPTMNKHTYSWLQRRCLLDADDTLLIPVLGKWIQEYW